MALFFRRSKKDDKSHADALYTKGQWAAALAAYERVLAKDPDNLAVLRRVGDLRAKLGRTKEAAEAYRELADRYARGGFLMQAIAVYKILERCDPEADDVGRRLAELYAQRGLARRGREKERPLPKIPLFSDLEPEAFRRVLQKTIPRSLSMGETLFRQGDPGESVFVVTSGVVRVERQGTVLAELGEGSFFGEAAFFSHEPRNADVVAVTPAELLEIRREDVEALIERYPGVADALHAFYRDRVLDGVLAASHAFRSLPPEERKELARRFEIVRVDAGDDVVREGETDRSVYIVKRGRFRVWTVPPGREESVVLATLGPGDLFGEVALVSHTPRTATVTAEEPGEVLRARAEDLEPVMGRHPQVRQALEALRDGRARDTVARILGKRP
ncbi:MAG: cyclic nucleotide-binding domain-containing protein [Deltaproteobacteria bacterium]|nr:cyclic nucleotide-binding domain-containing protein [Deltaproteobacteria bacterium]